MSADKKRIAKLCKRSPDEMLAKARGLEAGGALKEAQAIYEQLVAFHPHHAGLLTLLGVVHARQGHLAASIPFMERAISSASSAPEYMDAYYNLGLTMARFRKFALALSYYDKALAVNPNHAPAHSSKGYALFHLRDYDSAIASYTKAINIAPQFAQAHHGLGSTLYYVGSFDAALTSLNRALELSPEHADTHLNIGMIQLLLGDYKNGGRFFEWRWRSNEMKNDRPAQPLWQGTEPLAGKTILLYAEQGLGDTIQFCRYVPLAVDMGATVLLEVQRPLLSLMASLGSSCSILPQGSARPAFDFHCPLMSLPLAFQTTVDTIPATVPYLFADPSNLRQWQARLGPKARPRIGLAWSGAAQHKNDHNRSIALSAFAPLLRHVCDYHSLQTEIRAADLAFFSGSTIVSHAEHLADFLDTASLVSEMDLVITVDTSVAHLAGALGKPVWLLLPFVPDWRWLLEREDSPWYPTFRLFRQRCAGDWKSVITEVDSALAAFRLERIPLGGRLTRWV